MGLRLIIPLVFGGLIGFAIVMESYFAVLIFIFFLAGMALFRKVSSQHDRNASAHAATSYTFLLVASFGIGVLNLFALSKGAVTQQALATVLLALSVYPMWRFLKQGETGIPFVPLIAVIYGVYYGLPVFLPFEEYSTYHGYEYSEESRIKAQALVVLGLFLLLVVFYFWPMRLWHKLLPNMSMEWSDVNARHLAFISGILGLAAAFISRIIEIPEMLGALVSFCQQLSLVAIAIYFLLQLRKHLPVMTKLFLWVCLVPIQILFDLGSGAVFPIVRLGILLFMLYLLIKQKIPWRWVALGVPIVILLLATKGEFRQLTWGQESMQVSNPIEKGVLFLQVSGSFISSADSDQLYSALEGVARRFDLLSVFSYIVNETPDRVPYWGGASYLTLPWKAIPRILYPYKPADTQGQVFGHKYTILHPDDLTTSMNFPQLIEMYANFGIAGVMFGMFLLGLLYQVLYRTLNHAKAGSWGLVSAAVIFSSLTNIEGNFTLVYGGIIYWIVLLYLLGMLVRRRAPVLGTEGLSVAVTKQR